LGFCVNNFLAALDVIEENTSKKADCDKTADAGVLYVCGNRESNICGILGSPVNTTVGPVAGGGRAPGGGFVIPGPPLLLPPPPPPGALVLPPAQTMTQLQQGPDTLQFDAAVVPGGAAVEPFPVLFAKFAVQL